MKVVTKRTYGNCLFGIIYLYLVGKAKTVGGITSHSIIWPYHFVASNKNGNVLQYLYIEDRPENSPFWFEGHYIAIRKSKSLEYLKESKRNLCFEIPAAYFFWWATAMIISVHKIWILSFALYPIIRMGYDIKEVVDRRNVRLVNNYMRHMLNY